MDENAFICRFGAVFSDLYGLLGEFVQICLRDGDGWFVSDVEGQLGERECGKQRGSEEETVKGGHAAHGSGRRSADVEDAELTTLRHLPSSLFREGDGVDLFRFKELGTYWEWVRGLQLF